MRRALVVRTRPKTLCYASKPVATPVWRRKLSSAYKLRPTFNDCALVGRNRFREYKCFGNNTPYCAVIFAGLLSMPMVLAEDQADVRDHSSEGYLDKKNLPGSSKSTGKSFTETFKALNAILVNSNRGNKPEPLNTPENPAKVSGENDSNSTDGYSAGGLDTHTPSNSRNSQVSLLDWDGTTVHRDTNFLVIGDGIASQAALQYLKENKCPGETVLFEKNQADQIVDLNVDSKIVMMSSGKVIKYDQLLLTGDKLSTWQLHQRAPIDRRAWPLICSLGLGRNVTQNGDSKAEQIYLEGTAKLNEIIKSWNGKFRRKHVTVIGGGLQGIQSAFFLCDNVLGKSPKFPRISLICTENGPLSRYLPRHLSNVVASKMGKCGILLNSFSVIQYVAPLGLDNSTQSAKECEIFACRTYDTKTTFNFASNAVIFAPTRVRANTDWIKGNGVGLELNDEHGGIMVNNELAACSDVYVAGDLCSFPSNLGRRRIQGSRDHV